MQRANLKFTTPLLFKILTNATEAWTDVNLMHRVQIRKDRITVLVIADIAEMDSTVQVHHVCNHELYFHLFTVLQ